MMKYRKYIKPKLRSMTHFIDFLVLLTDGKVPAISFCEGF